MLCTYLIFQCPLISDSEFAQREIRRTIQFWSKARHNGRSSNITADGDLIEAEVSWQDKKGSAPKRVTVRHNLCLTYFLRT